MNSNIFVNIRANYGNVCYIIATIFSVKSCMCVKKNIQCTFHCDLNDILFTGTSI